MSRVRFMATGPNSVLTQLVEYQTVNLGVRGSKPRDGVQSTYGQVVRRLFSKEEIVRSNRTRCNRDGAVEAHGAHNPRAE